MGRIIDSRQVSKFMRLAVALALTILGALLIPSVFGASGDEAPDSTIALQMPFIAGETWIVGGLTLGCSSHALMHPRTALEYYAPQVTDFYIVNLVYR